MEYMFYIITIGLVICVFQRWLAILLHQKTEKTMDDLEAGNILINKDNSERVKILGICGEVYFLSALNDFEIAKNYIYTLVELKGNFELETPQEEVKEWTKDELAKLAGVDVKDFKIKKE